jgi:aquaporin Z
MAYAIGPISGCHINPAVTAGMFFARKINARDAIGYTGGQIIGAIIAAGLVLLVAKGGPEGYSAAASGLASNGYGAHSPAGYSLFSGLIVEIILTAFLVFTVLGSTDIKAPVGFAGLPIGLVLTLIHLVGIPVTNTSVNPARSIGTAIFAGGWALQQLWLFIVAPLIGAMAAAFAYALVRPSAAEITTLEAERALESQRQERERKRIA